MHLTPNGEDRSARSLLKRRFLNSFVLRRVSVQRAKAITNEFGGIYSAFEVKFSLPSTVNELKACVSLFLMVSAD